MTQGRKATKIVAIAVAVLLLIAAAVGIVLVLRPARANAVGTTGQTYFTVEVPNGCNFDYGLSAGNSFSSVLGAEALWDIMFKDLNQSVVGFEKVDNAGGGTSYKVYVNDEKKASPITLSLENIDWSLFDDATPFTIAGVTGQGLVYAAKSPTNTLTIYIPEESDWQNSANIKISPKLKVVEYKVTYTPSSNYTVTPCNESGDIQAGQWKVESGKSFYFKVSVTDPNYEVKSIFAGTEKVEKKAESEDIYEIKQVSEDVNLTIELTKKSYSVTVKGDGQGTRYTTSIGEGTKATAGDTFQFSVSPVTGYTVTSVSATMGKQSADIHPNGTSYSIYNVSGNIEVTVQTAAATFNVTYNIPSNVTYADSGAVPTYNMDFKFTLTPANGYKVASITYTVKGTSGSNTIEGVPSENNEYLIPGDKVTNDITISATVVPIDYTITINGADADNAEMGSNHATYSQEFSTTAAYGETVDLTLTPKEGWKISKVSVSVDGTSIGVTGATDVEVATTYSFPVNKFKAGNSHTVTVTVTTVAIPRTVTLAPNSHCSLNSAQENASIAEDYKFSLTADKGYTIGTVKHTVANKVVDMTLTEQDGQYTIPKANITGDITITVETTANTYNVTVNATVDGANKTLSDAFTVKIGGQDPSEDTKATHGTDLLFTVVAKDGYAINDKDGVTGSVDGNPQTIIRSGNTYRIAGTNVTGEVVITIEGTEYEYTIVYSDSRISLDDKTLKYSSDEWGDGTFTLPKDEVTYYDRKWTQNVSGRDQEITTVSRNDIKGGNKTITVTATWTLNEQEVKYLLDFKTTLKSGEYNKAGSAVLQVELSTNDKSSKSAEWTKFLSENGTFQTHLVLGFAVFATGGSDGKDGYTSVQDAQSYWSSEGKSALTSAFASSDIFEQSTLGLLSANKNGADLGTWGVAFGVAYSSNANWFSYSYKSDGEKLTRRALAFFIGVKTGDGAEHLLVSEVKSVQDVLQQYQPKAVAEPAILPSASSDDESYEEPTID